MPQRVTRFVRIAFLLLLTVGSIAGARGQAFPTKPVRIITIQSPGSAVDIVARTLAQELTTRWGRTVVVENRVGAAGLIAAEAAAKAPADGYTLFLSTSGVMSLNPHIYAKLPYHPVRDYQAIALVTTYPYILLVNAAVPAKSLTELVALSKRKANGITYGSVGPGALSNIAAQLMRDCTGAALTYVGYKAVSGAITDVVSGQIDMFFDTIAQAAPLVNDGKVRALAVTSPRRLEKLPDVLTMEELGCPQFNVANWIGLYAPAGTPAELVKRIGQDTVNAIRSASLSDRLLALGMNPTPLDADAFDAFNRRELERWGVILNKLQIKPEN